MRLVDITLLLLLSLMAAASFTTSGPDPPTTYELEDQGTLMTPLQVRITTNGSIHTQAGVSITLEDLEHLLDGWPTAVEFIADAEAPASQLLALHTLSSRLGLPAAFRVRQIQGGSP